jgi:Xaa-Pro aminopeptidase
MVQARRRVRYLAFGPDAVIALTPTERCRAWPGSNARSPVRAQRIRGGSTHEIARHWPTAHEIGLAGEREAFGLEFGHGLGLALHERPIISPLSSLETPSEIKEGMVFALETYSPATDGESGARIEEEVVVTRDGPRVMTRFPSQSLFVTHDY